MASPMHLRAPVARYRRLRALLREVTEDPSERLSATAALQRATTLAAELYVLKPSLVAVPAAPNTAAVNTAPSPEDRNRLTTGDMVTLFVAQQHADLAPGDMGPDVTQDDPLARTQLSIRLTHDYVQATVLLSDEFNINEMEAAALLYEARLPAARRPDRDVLIAAREMYIEERRELILCTQEVLRAAIALDRGQHGRDIDVLIQWRDAIVTAPGFWDGLADRLAALALAKQRANTNNSLHNAPISHQHLLKQAGLLNGEALLIAETLFLVSYTVQLTATQALQLASMLADFASFRDNTPVHHFGRRPLHGQETSNADPNDVEMDSIVYILLLSWTSALDRSRFRDIYNPHDKTTDVNRLLTDENFITKSAKVEPLAEDCQQDPVAAMNPFFCCSQLVATVFRSAIHEPDHELEAHLAGRLSAAGGALHVLGSMLPNWLESGQGSLRPDADLYAEVFEELVFDLTEAPSLTEHMLDLTANRARDLAADTENSNAERETNLDPLVLDSLARVNLTASLATVVVRAVTLVDTADWDGSEPLRYWAGQGGSPAVVMQLGDAVLDLGDIAMNNPESPGGVGILFTTALSSFLRLLSGLSLCSAAYASAVLTFLAQGGHSLASLEQTHLALAYYTKSIPSGRQFRLSEAESRAFCGVVSAVASSASVLKDTGGVSSYTGTDFPMRIAALCTLAPPSEQLHVDLLRSLLLFDHLPSILAYLEMVSVNRCAVLRVLLNREASTGEYRGTILILQLVSRVIAATPVPDEAPEPQIPQSCRSIAVFVVEEIVSSWDRRHYKSRFERWAVAQGCVELLWAASGLADVVRVMLTPAPGTGEAAPPLRSLASMAGMCGSPAAGRSDGEKGSAALASAMDSGDAKTLQCLEMTSSVASRLLASYISIASDPSRHRTSSARIDELLLGETQSLIAVASLIGAGSICSADCASFVLAIATASERLASVLVRDGSNEQLRSSFASITRGDVPNYSEDRDLLGPVLSITLACLGKSGSDRTGLFLLGVSTDMESEYGGHLAEYGVIAGLCDRLSETTAMDDGPRATAALFLAHICVGTPSKTSTAILRYLKDADYLTSFEQNLEQIVVMDTTNVDWENICKFAGACMRLVALEVKLFERGDSSIPRQLLGLLKILKSACADGMKENAAKAFVGWRHLLGSVLSSSGRGDQDDLAGILCDIATEILQGLSGANGEFVSMFEFDAGLGGADAVLLCISRLRGDAVAHSKVQPSLMVSRIGSLLQYLCQAVLGKIPERSDAPSTRSSLYVAFIHCVQYMLLFTPKESSKDIIRRVITASYLSEKTIAMAMISLASRDGGLGAPASRASALSFCAMLAQIDATSGSAMVPAAFGKHNRLRKLIVANLGDPGKVRGSVRAMTSLGRSNTSLVSWDVNARAADVSSLFLIETSLALCASLASSRAGSQLIVSSGSVEHIGTLLQEISRVCAELLDKPDGQAALWGDNAEFSNDESLTSGERNATSKFASVVSAICTVLSAIVSNGQAHGVHAGDFRIRVNAAVQNGHDVLSEILRRSRDSNIQVLRAANSVCLLLSAIKSVSQAEEKKVPLSILAAQNLGLVLARAKDKGSASMVDFRFDPLGPGSISRAPTSPAEARRQRILHPRGGNLFERDVAAAKIDCILGFMTCVRQNQDMMHKVFDPTLMATSHTGSISLGKRVAPLADVAFVAGAAFHGLERYSEEAMRLSSDANQAVASISSTEISDLRSFCQEEYSIASSAFSPEILLDCLAKSAATARTTADACIVLLEAALYVLREYCELARRIAHGDQQGPFSIDESGRLLDEAKSILMPLAQKIDTSRSELWGDKNSEFGRQMGRDIRTCTTAISRN